MLRTPAQNPTVQGGITTGTPDKTQSKRLQKSQ